MARNHSGSRAEKRGDNTGQRSEAVYRATLAIATELSLDAALQKIVDAARELVNARYGALGVIDDERRQLTHFIVSGVTVEQVGLMGHWPRGLGLLGELVHFPRPLRVKEISKDPRSVGFPPHHPPMTSFLGVPILRGDRVLGNLYMTDKQGAEEFSEADEEILSLFAAHAAIAIENARLYTETDSRLKQKILEVERAERRSRYLAELGVMLLRLPPGEDPELQPLAERATEPLGDAAAIYLVDPEKPETVLASAHFHRIPARQQAAEEVLEQSSATIREQVTIRGRAILATDSAGEVSSVFDPQSLARGRFSAALAVPIATRQKTFGFLASLASRPLKLTEDDLRFALLVADRLGDALHSARLYRGERQAGARIEELALVAQQRASELETVLDTMAEPVYVVDTSQNLIRLNQAYARLVGLESHKGSSWSLGEHIERLQPRSERGQPLPTDELPVSRALRGESFTNQVILVRPVGSKGDRFLSVSGAPIRDISGAIVAAVNVARDVTETKELDQLRDEFISVASHELKTPLTVMKGYAQLLARKLDATNVQAAEAGMARRILDQANRMASLAERLLDVSRIQFGRLALEKRRVDLARLIADVSEQMQVGGLGHPIQASAEQPVPAEVDPGRLEQVLVNLITNAARYSPEGTAVDVTLERRGCDAMISVRDRGYGIPAEQQAYVFQRYYRARTGEGKVGLGLGLYLAKGIVEAHGGKIWFESKEDQGTTFHVLLPVE